MAAALIHLDADTAGHAAVAIKRHVDVCKRLEHDVPDKLDDLLCVFLEIARSGQERSPGDDLHPMRREWLTTKEAAELVGVSESTIRRRVLDGSLPSAKTGRSRRIRQSELDRHMAA